jgi:hypothetical protein
MYYWAPREVRAGLPGCCFDCSRTARSILDSRPSSILDGYQFGKRKKERYIERVVMCGAASNV